MIPALLAALALLGAPDPGRSTCAFPAPPVVVIGEEARLLQYWLVEDAAPLASELLPASPALADFRARVEAVTAVTHRALLEAQLPHVEGGDAENVRLVLSGEVGAIRPIRCLEALLLATQAERTLAQGRPMADHPTEFLAYVLERGGVRKVWYYTVDQAGVGGLAALHGPVAADVREGWAVVVALHNHNFFLDSARILGGVAPSATDVGYLANMAPQLGIPRASITNGFHTLEVAAEDFARLAGG